MRNINVGREVFKLLMCEMNKKDKSFEKNYVAASQAKKTDFTIKYVQPLKHKYMELYDKGNKLVHKDVENWIAYLKTLENKFDERIQPATNSEAQCMQNLFKVVKGKNGRKVWRPSQLNKRKLVYKRAESVAQNIFNERDIDAVDAYVDFKNITIKHFKTKKKIRGIAQLTAGKLYSGEQHVIKLAFINYKKIGISLLIKQVYDDLEAFEKEVQYLQSIQNKGHKVILQYINNLYLIDYKYKKEGLLKSNDYLVEDWNKV